MIATVPYSEAESEARWTAPRDDCPHPEWWHSADDESTEREVSLLVAAFVRALQPEVVVESGTATGQTAEAIGLALRDNGHGHLYTTETDPERAHIARLRCQILPVTVLEQPTSEFGPPGPVGFAWIDGHIAERAADLSHLRPYLAPGAVVGVHDASPFHGIRQLVEAETWIRWIYLPTPRGVLFGEVVG